MTPAVDCGGASDLKYQPRLAAIWYLSLVALLILPLLLAKAKMGYGPIGFFPFILFSLGGMVWFTGQASYTIEGLVITRHYVSMTRHVKRTSRRNIRAITHWKNDFGTTKNSGRYEYLELDAEGGPRWSINSMRDPEGFAAFKEAFFAVLAELEQAGHRMPTRQPGFYGTTLGRLTTLATAVGAVAFVVAALAGILSFDESWWLVVLLGYFAGYGYWRYKIEPK